MTHDDQISMEQRDEYRRQRRGDWNLWLGSGWREEWWPEIEKRALDPREVISSSRHARTMKINLAGAGCEVIAYLKVYHRTDSLSELKDRFRFSKPVRAL